jgi:hypothetical protein
MLTVDLLVEVVREGACSVEGDQYVDQLSRYGGSVGDLEPP